MGGGGGGGRSVCVTQANCLSQVTIIIGPQGWGTEGWGPKFRAVFSLSRTIFFLSSLGGLLVEFWWCLKRQVPQMCTFGVLGLSCSVGLVALA